ncbi:MAG: phenylalanine--tRNA ligase subunit beta [Phycisphaerales bacterium]|nr:phenylalanine--tRNA ligase subunit beta [Phycisphaerales bacterium]
MKASVRWLNSLLSPADLTPDQADAALTNAGFPIDARTAVGDDTQLEVEVTSNRGDCLSHCGLAREIAASTGRTLVLPPMADPLKGEPVGGLLRLRNTVPAECPRFIAIVIRGVKIAPSPAWLRKDLEGAGQRPLGNAVDVTNWLNLGFGQPAHVFDLAKVGGGEIVIRRAHPGEALATLDGKVRKLAGDEVVVADAARALSLAGVMGGADSEVTPATTDIVLEVATWDPVAVRRAARRHGIRSDASHRYERIVDPRPCMELARRAAGLIAGLCGGRVCEGELDDGPPLPPARTITLRPQRCRDILGYPVSDDEIAATLARLDITSGTPPLRGGSSPSPIAFSIPFNRPDLEREIDLIEEVGRVAGLARVPVHDRITVQVRPPQESERAAREIAGALTALGFFEAVTITFITPRRAALFLPDGCGTMEVSDQTRASEPTLRPSILPSLLACRKSNQDAGVHQPGGVRLFETASTFLTSPRGERAGSSALVETRRLALVLDVPGGARPGVAECEHAVRLLRGAIEHVARTVAGRDAALRVESVEPGCPGFDPAACARVSLGGKAIGHYGLLAPAAQAEFDLASRVALGELDLAPLTDLYPPKAAPVALPQYPAIERDVSLLLDDAVPWSRVAELVGSAGLDRLESLEFVGSYRGRQVSPGKKSVTLRLRFRDPERTLRHEDADGQVRAVIDLAAARLGASLRAS